MIKNNYKNLTVKLFFVGISLLITNSWSAILTVENFKTHKRFNIFAVKDQVFISKKENKTIIQTLNLEIYEKLAKDLKEINLDKKYFSELKTLGQVDQNNIFRIEISLTNPAVELFSFYRDQDKKYILDFWIDEKKLPQEIVAKNNDLPAKQENKNNPKQKQKPVKKKIIKEAKLEKSTINHEYRDFRYGAAFVWDYLPLAPAPSMEIDLTRKTPEAFYEIKDRDISKGPKQSHLQLCINLYRKKQWGLMYKSIKLFNDKYGSDDSFETLEYLKANAILRNSLDKGEREPEKMAIAILNVLAQKTTVYDQRKAIYKYLVTYYVNNKDYVEALKSSKELYVASKENFDYEETGVVAELILYNLSMLNQIDKIKEVVLDKTIKKLLPKQTLIAYQIYVYLKRNDIDHVIKIYLENKQGMEENVSLSILYNVAEAYFRKADYDNAIKLFDGFASKYSYHTNSSHARLRIALSYDLLDKEHSFIKELYMNAYNRSQDLSVRYEAGLRIVGLESVRKISLTEADRELRVFLDRDNKKINQDLKDLLWLVRLRTFIVDHKFHNGMSYLKAIPLNTMIAAKSRVFEADAGEIVYGLIKSDYEKGLYVEAIKIWEVYKDKYLGKVANDVYLNFLIGKSYLKLGLYEGFDRIYGQLNDFEKSPNKTYPLWLDRKYGVYSKLIMKELDVERYIKLKNWDLAEKKLVEINNVDKGFDKINFYKGIINYNKNNYKDAIVDFQKYLLSKKTSKDDDPEDVAILIDHYATALYETSRYEEFLAVSTALLSDTRGFAPKHTYLNKVKERVSYLSIELFSSEKNKKIDLEGKILAFVKRWPASEHVGRVKYLQGKLLIGDNRSDEGKKLFSDILGNELVSDQIKDLVRSELSLLEIREKTIL